MSTRFMLALRATVLLLVASVATTAASADPKVATPGKQPFIEAERPASKLPSVSKAAHDVVAKALALKDDECFRFLRAVSDRYADRICVPDEDTLKRYANYATGGSERGVTRIVNDGTLRPDYGDTWPEACNHFSLWLGGHSVEAGPFLIGRVTQYKAARKPYFGMPEKLPLSHATHSAEIPGVDIDDVTFESMPAVLSRPYASPEAADAAFDTIRRVENGRIVISTPLYTGRTYAERVISADGFDILGCYKVVAQGDTFVDIAWKIVRRFSEGKDSGGHAAWHKHELTKSVLALGVDEHARVYFEVAQALVNRVTAPAGTDARYAATLLNGEAGGLAIMIPAGKLDRQMCRLRVADGFIEMDPADRGCAYSFASGNHNLDAPSLGVTRVRTSLTSDIFEFVDSARLKVAKGRENVSLVMRFKSLRFADIDRDRLPDALTAQYKGAEGMLLLRQAAEKTRKEESFATPFAEVGDVYVVRSISVSRLDGKETRADSLVAFSVLALGENTLTIFWRAVR